MCHAIVPIDRMVIVCSAKRSHRVPGSGLRRNRCGQGLFSVTSSRQLQSRNPCLLRGYFFFDRLLRLLPGSTICASPYLGSLKSGIFPVLELVYHHFWKQSLLRSEEHTSELQSRPHLVCR